MFKIVTTHIRNLLDLDLNERLVLMMIPNQALCILKHSFHNLKISNHLENTVQALQKQRAERLVIKCQMKANLQRKIIRQLQKRKVSNFLGETPINKKLIFNMFRFKELMNPWMTRKTRTSCKNRINDRHLGSSSYRRRLRTL